MAVTLANTINVVDDGGVELSGVISVATAAIGTRTFLYIAGFVDNGVSVFQLNAAGSVNLESSVDDGDDADLELLGASAVAVVPVDGQQFVFATGFTDNGISGFAALGNGALINTTNVDDGDNPFFEIAGATALASAVIGGKTFLFVAGQGDDGVSAFEVVDDGTVIHRSFAVDEGARELLGAQALATATVGGTTYLFAAGLVDDGISVFSVSAAGVLTNQFNLDDASNAALELNGAAGLATAVVGGKTFLFAAGFNDHGVSVFRVNANGSLENVDNVSDTAALELSGAFSPTTANIAGTTYLFVPGLLDNGVSVFAVAADGSLVNMANIDDASNPALELRGASSVATAVVGGKTFLIVAGQTDDGFSVFRVDTTGLTINGTGGNDVINALNAPAGELLPSELGDVINGLGGNDNISGLGGGDILIGGRGRDIMFGNAGRDDFDFNTIKESKKGSQRDKIMDLKRGQDDIDLRTIDAKTGGGNQAFKFIGKQDFHDVKGELRYEDKGSKVIVQGDVNGDGKSDFEIFVKVGSLAKGDFLL